MWFVCKLVADRSLKPKPISGTWQNGATMTGYIYPDKAIPVVSFGTFRTRNEAVRSLVLTYYPELESSRIEHLKRISKEFLTGSLKTYKIINNPSL